MATGSPQDAWRSFLTNSLAAASVALMLMFVGFSLLGYYQSNPDRLPEGKTLETGADQLFPYFISVALPPGIAGLILAGLFAAAMSNIDSGSSSRTAMTPRVSRATDMGLYSQFATRTFLMDGSFCLSKNSRTSWRLLLTIYSTGVPRSDEVAE